MNHAAIVARDVEVRVRDVVLVRDISLAVQPGELLALVGPNGAGKSTLLGALAGDRRITAGTITLAGTDVHRTSPRELARLRAVLPQRSQLALPFTACEVVQLGGAAVPRAHALRLLAAVAMRGFADRSYLTLSGGEQQRVQLARVLAQLSLSPHAALLLDEPTSALDARHQQLVLQLARRVAGERRAVVVVLHDLTLAARWCDGVALLAAGHLVAHGRSADVLQPSVLEQAYGVPFELLRGAGGSPVIAPLVR